MTNESRARLIRDVPLIGGTLRAGIQILITAPAGPGRWNAKRIGGGQSVCRLERDAFELLDGELISHEIASGQPGSLVSESTSFPPDTTQPPVPRRRPKPHHLFA